MSYFIVQDDENIEGRVNRMVFTGPALRQRNAFKLRQSAGKIDAETLSRVQGTKTRRRDVVLSHYVRLSGSGKIEHVSKTQSPLLGTTDFNEGYTPREFMGEATHIRIGYGFLPAVDNSGGEPSPGLVNYRRFNPAIPVGLLNSRFDFVIGGGIPQIYQMPYNHFLSAETASGPNTVGQSWIEMDQSIFFYPKKKVQWESELIDGLAYTKANGDPGHYLCIQFRLPDALVLE